MNKWIYIFVSVIFILYFIGSYNGNNGSSNNTRYSSSEKGIIEVCESFSADLKLDFKGSPSECYKFLNSYKNSLNREVNNLLPVLALAISSTNNSNMLVLANHAKNSIRTDCKNKTLNKSHGREYLVKCMVDMQMMPGNLIEFIKITNSHAQMQKARQIRRDAANRMISSGLSLMGGNKSYTPSTNSSSKGIVGATKVCNYRNNYAITVSKGTRCPTTVNKSIFGTTKVCINNRGDKAVTVGSGKMCPVGYRKR